MKKSIRGTAPLLLVVSLLVSVLTGCQLPGPAPAAHSTSPDEASAEIELVGIVEGGFFYTPGPTTSDADEATYLTLRKEAIGEFKKALESLAQSESKVTSSVKAHEDLLLKYMDMVSDRKNDSIRQMTEGMLAYRAAFLSYEDESAAYLSAQTKNALLRSYLDRLFFETVCAQVSGQTAYLSWLMGSTEVTAALLEENNPQQAQELVRECAALYKDKLDGIYTEMLEKYYNAAELFTYILSADYYIGEYYLTDMESTLSKTPDAGVAKNIGKLVGSLLAADRKPSVLLDMKAATPFTRSTRTLLSAQAFEAKPVSRNTMTANAVSLLEQLPDVTDTAGSQEEKLKPILKDLVLNTNQTNTIRDSFGAELNTGSAADVRSTVAKELGATPDSGETAQLTEQGKAMQADASDTEAVRQKLIDEISKAQNAMDNLDLVGDEWLAEFGTSKYAIIIKAANYWLRTQQTLDGDKLENIKNLVNEDLEAVLGENKEEFIRIIQTTKAEELVNLFDKWKGETKNFSTLTFTRDDLIRLMTTIGVPVKEEPQDPTPTPSTAPEQPSAAPSPSVSAQVVSGKKWTGTVRYTEGTWEFTDGSAQTSKLANAEGAFEFTISDEGETNACTVRKMMTYDINGYIVTRFEWDGENMKLTLEGERPKGVKWLFYWEGTVSSDGSAMSGSCKIITVFTDDYIKEHPPEPNFPTTVGTEQRGEFTVERLY